MALIPLSIDGTPWIIDDTNKRIYRDISASPEPDPENSAERVTTLSWYSTLQNRFDEPDFMDDEPPVSAQTPTDFTMVNEWFVDQRSLRFLRGGAVQSNSWDGVIRKLTFDATGYENASDADIGEAVTGSTTGNTGTLLAYDNTTREWWIRVTLGGSPDNLFDAAEDVTIPTSTSSPIPQGTMSAASDTGEYLFTNLFTLGTVEATTDLYIDQGGSKLLPQFWADGQIDILVKVRDSGALIDSGLVTVFARQYGKLFDNFSIDLSVGGRQPVPLATGVDLNNTTGYREISYTQNSPELSLAVGDVLLVNGVRTAVVTSFTAGLIRYYQVGRDAATGAFVDFSSDTVTVSGKTGSLVTGASSNEYGPGERLISPQPFWTGGTAPTLSAGAVVQNLGTGTSNAPYSATIDCQGNTLAEVYEWVKFITRRNATTTVSPSEDPVFLAFDLDGQFYKGIELRITLGGNSSPTYTEGEVVTGGTSGATAVVVGNHVLTGNGDYVTVRDVKGTFLAAETLTGGTSGEVQTISTATSVSTPKSSPFGTFAGGTFFGAPGIYITNMAAGDIQNYQLIDDLGNVQNPPNAVAVTVQSLLSGDRAAVFELDAPLGSGGEIIKNKFTLTAGSAGSPLVNQVGGHYVEISAGTSPDIVPFDTPASGVIRLVDTSTGTEQRYRFASFSLNQLLLEEIPDGTNDTLDATGITLEDTGASFTGVVEIGDVIFNVTDGSSCRVVEVVSGTVITTTGLTDGTDNQWQVSDSYTINKLDRTYGVSDTAYIPLLDGVSTGASLVSDTLIFDTNIDVVVRVRQAGGILSPSNPILPFETAGTVTSAGLTVTAIRTPDTISTV